MCSGGREGNATTRCGFNHNCDERRGKKPRLVWAAFNFITFLLCPR